MGGERPFDDERWPDAEGFAACFLCGRKVDPRDPHRGSYTPNVSACEPLPIHLPCAEGKLELHIQVAAMAALNQMTAYQIKRSQKAANISTVSPLGT